MNKQLIIGGVILLLVAGGAVLLSNQGGNSAPQQAQTPTQSVTQAPSPTQAPKATNVTITKTGFEPESVTIKVGEKVIWTNSSGGLATVNSDPHPVHTTYPSLNIGSVQDGQTEELTFPKAGTYTYHDHLHPNRRGTVIVTE